jgi:hypothetical protein
MIGKKIEQEEPSSVIAPRMNGCSERPQEGPHSWKVVVSCTVGGKEWSTVVEKPYLTDAFTVAGLRIQSEMQAAGISLLSPMRPGARMATLRPEGGSGRGSEVRH